MINSNAKTPAPANTLKIIEGRVALEHQRLRAANRIDKKRETIEDIRRNMGLLASELPVEWDGDYIDRQMKDPEKVENLKHLVDIGVLKPNSPIVLAATREDNETGERPIGRHLMESKWQSERSASSHYALNRGSQPPEYAFNLNVTQNVATCAWPGGKSLPNIFAKPLLHVSEDVSKDYTDFNLLLRTYYR